MNIEPWPSTCFNFGMRMSSFSIGFLLLVWAPTLSVLNKGTHDVVAECPASLPWSDAHGQGAAAHSPVRRRFALLGGRLPNMAFNRTPGCAAFFSRASAPGAG